MAILPRPVHCQLAFLLSFILLTLIPCASAYTAIITSAEYSRGACDGMWGGSYINVTFDSISQGAFAMVIYNWNDLGYLGKSTSSRTGEELPRTYVCTTSTMALGYCTSDQLGRYILNLPPGKAINETSFWSARVEFPSNKTAVAGRASGFWDNPEGNSTPANSTYSFPSRQRAVDDTGVFVRQAATSTGPNNLLSYSGTIHYPVSKTGYYCVDTIPVTVQGSIWTAATESPYNPANTPYHPPYQGTVLFKTTWDGQLNAGDHPKIQFYFIMFVVYSCIGLLWGFLCYRHIHELLPIQYYLSGLISLFAIEMFASWAYYRYLNVHGRTTTSTAFLLGVSILDSARHSMSLFMILVVSSGLSVVKESLSENTMFEYRALTALHFFFGITYSIWIVELFQSITLFNILFLILPLSFASTGFYFFIFAELFSTIADLEKGKQRYKLSMFNKLRYILIFTVVSIGIYYVVAFISLNGKSAQDYEATTWRFRWGLVDGWMVLTYLFAFSFIAFLWRPSSNNQR